MNRHRWTMSVVAMLLALAIAPNSSAQNWPTKPVKLIAVFPAGGSVDQVAGESSNIFSMQRAARRRKPSSKVTI